MMKKISKHLIAGCLLLLMAGCAQEQADFQTTLEAAEQGHASAQNNLGVMYDRGAGVPQDNKAALDWYRKAAEQGNAEAQTNLGFSYYYDVPQDYKVAAQWFRKAAEQGHAEAQFMIGTMYFYGNGVPQDDSEAYAWYNIAAAKGNELASESRDIAAKKLSPRDLSEAQALATKYYELYVMPFE